MVPFLHALPMLSLIITPKWNPVRESKFYGFFLLKRQDFLEVREPDRFHHPVRHLSDHYLRWQG